MDLHEQNKWAVTSELSSRESALDLEVELLDLNLRLAIYYYLQYSSLLEALRFNVLNGDNSMHLPDGKD